MAKDVSNVAWEALRQECFDEHGRLCVYCGKATATVIDHVLPESRGGLSVKENLLPACNGCNVSKGNRTYQEWFRDNLNDLRELRRRRDECIAILGKSLLPNRTAEVSVVADAREANDGTN